MSTSLSTFIPHLLTFLTSFSLYCLLHAALHEIAYAQAASLLTHLNISIQIIIKIVVVFISLSIILLSTMCENKSEKRKKKMKCCIYEIVDDKCHKRFVCLNTCHVWEDACISVHIYRYWDRCVGDCCVFERILWFWVGLGSHQVLHMLSLA